MSKKLVAYFSASGTTAAVARMLAEAAGSDLYEIKPQTVSKDNRLGQPQTPIFMLTQKIIRQICRSYALMG